MNRFCTLFDCVYLTRGLALYRSLRAAGEPFELHVLCMDDVTGSILRALQLPGLVIIDLAAFESNDLRTVKTLRTRAEYCWTCTPHLIRYLLRDSACEECTYLDADLHFYGPASELLAPFRAGGRSVLITPHRYTKRYDQSALSGIYCVQFMTFRNDPNGIGTLEWWCERCTEWCYSRYEDGKFGDQKYLDDWPERFAGVEVLQHPGGGLAPWNVQQFARFYRQGERCYIDGIPLVFYHFHHLRQYNDGMLDLGPYRLPAWAVSELYRPYLHALHMAELEIVSVCGEFKQMTWPQPRVYERIKRFLKRYPRGEYNLVRME